MEPPTHFIITHEKMEQLHHLSIWLGSEEGLTMQKGATVKKVKIPEEFLSDIQKHAKGVKGDRELFAKLVYQVEPYPDGKLATDVSYHPKGAFFDFQKAPLGVRRVPRLGSHIEGEICLKILEEEAGVTHIAPSTPPTIARREQLMRKGLPTGNEVTKQIVPISEWRKKLRK